MEPKLHSNVSVKFIQSILLLEHPSTIGNSNNEGQGRKNYFQTESSTKSAFR